jgi:L-lactate dehydrogenase (cytochrome)
MGYDSRLPFFIAPAAQARLGHTDGEMCLARGAARFDIPYCSSSYSSIAHDQLSRCLRDEQKGGVLFFQLYVPIIKRNAEKLIREARELGYKALVVTVDTAVVGRREEDDRYKAELDHATGLEIPRTTNPSDAVDAPVLRGAHSSTLEWDDLPWICRAWNGAGPVVLKGIQTVEDAVQAVDLGVDGLYLCVRCD